MQVRERDLSLFLNCDVRRLESLCLGDIYIIITRPLFSAFSPVFDPPHPAAADIFKEPLELSTTPHNQTQEYFQLPSTSLLLLTTYKDTHTHKTHTHTHTKIHTHIHIHTHKDIRTHTCKYMYIYTERESERGRERRGGNWYVLGPTKFFKFLFIYFF